MTAGYADGYPRHLSNRGAAVLVRGRRCALLGRVTMDLMMIDVSHVEGVDVGEEVVLMGGRGRGDFVRGVGGKGRHDHMGNYDANWRAREARLFLRT